MPKSKRKLPRREEVFVKSLMYHGFRKTHQRENLKYAYGYIIAATKYEDGGGTDFWIKMPRDARLFPIQVTQRGVRLYRKHHRASETQLAEFIEHSEKRVRTKRMWCKRYGIAFVLVRDHGGRTTNPTLAWGDIKALRYAIAHLRRWL